MPDPLRKDAAAYVDGEYRRTQNDLFTEHRRQEQRELAMHKTRLESFARNRELSGQRYVQRLRTIEEKRDRIADRLHQQHRSLGGRLEALTKKGRERQADQLQRLDDRAATLTARATRQLEARKERQFEAEQSNRITYARQLKTLRQDHYGFRLEQTRRHIQTRDVKIDDRVRAMKLSMERSLRQEFQRQQADDRQRTAGRTLRQNFHQQGQDQQTRTRSR
jgi:hypothetical protein